MIVVEQLAAKFQIQFIPEHGNSFADMGRLHLQILLIVKTDIHKKLPV